MVFVRRPRERDERVRVEQVDHDVSSKSFCTSADVTIGASAGKSKIHTPSTCFSVIRGALARRISSVTAWPSLIARAWAYVVAVKNASSSIVMVVLMMTASIPDLMQIVNYDSWRLWGRSHCRLLSCKALGCVAVTCWPYQRVATSPPIVIPAKEAVAKVAMPRET